jgi:cysteine desulfurase
VGSTDHKSALAAASALELEGLKARQVRVDTEGRFDLDDLRSKVDSDTLMLSISLVNSEIGTIQDAVALQRIAHACGAVLHLDAAQAPCALDMTALAAVADMVSLSAHKMYGPKGIGVLYVKRSLHLALEPLVHCGGQQHNLRSGTLPTPLCVAMAAAARKLSGQDAAQERQRTRRLRDGLVSKLKSLPWPVVMNGPALDYRHPGNANLRFVGFSAHDLLLSSLQPKLATSTGSACSSGSIEPSYVLREIGLSKVEAASSVRFCIGRHTTEEDTVAAVELISEALTKLSTHGLRETFG